MSEQTLNSLHEKIEIKDGVVRVEKSENRSWSSGISMRIVLQIANLSYCWFATVFVYYGLNLNSVYLEYWNKYVNFIVSKLKFLNFSFLCVPFSIYKSFTFLLLHHDR